MLLFVLSSMAKQSIFIEKKRIEANERVQKHAINAKVIGTIVSRLITFGGIGFIVYCIMQNSVLIVSELSGRTTEANIFLKFLGDFNVSFLLTMGAGFSGVIYGQRQHTLRKRNVKNMSERIDELEKQIDPNKQSSNILPTGETRREDKC